MPRVKFLVTRNGEAALRLPSEVSHKQATPEGLRKTFFEQTGRDAFVLHDGGLGLGLDRESFVVRLEDSGTARDPYEPLEHARAWQQPGWYRETLEWLSRKLGNPLIKTEQISTNDLACVLWVTTELQTVYLKASETGFEAALTAQLAARHPDLTPQVITQEVQRSVLVTRDCGLRLSETPELAYWNTAVTKLAHFQRRADAVTFQKLGCPVYDFTALADRAETFLHNADTLRRWGLTEAQTSRLQAQLPRIRSAYRRVSALNLPLLPAHGDAHPMNALTGCGLVWFDLNEACLAHPLLDIGWFSAWLSHPARGTLPLRQTQPNAAMRLWHVYLQTLGLPRATDLNDVMVLSLTHRTLVYHERFRDWQGTIPGWRPQYVPYFLRSLLGLL